MLGKQPPTQFGFDNLPPDAPTTRWSELLRAIDRLIDFSPVREMAAPYFADNGRPSVDPILMFKIMLVGFLLGIPSDRRLIDDCKDRASIREFLGLGWSDDLPVHSSLTHWRQRLGPNFFRLMLHEIAQQCADHGMVLSGTRVVDATTVKARASRRGPTASVPRDEIDGFVDECFDQDRDHDRHADEDNGEIIGEVEPDHTDDDDGDDATGSSARSSVGDDKTILVNMHDPDARLQRKTHETAEFRYNVSFCTDMATGLITDATATGFERAWTTVEHVLHDPGSVDEIVFDALYDAGHTLQALQHLGVRCYVPPPRPRSDNKFDKSLFTYVPLHDIYLCPHGKVLKYCRNDSSREQIHYIALQSECGACPDKQRCTEAKRRSVSRQYTQDARDRAVRAGHRYQVFMRQRRIDEHLNMLAKRDHAMSLARGLGLEAMQIQAAGTAMAIDLKRLVKFKGRVDDPTTAEQHRVAASAGLLALFCAVGARGTHRRRFRGR